MKPENNQIKCPNCSELIDVNNILSHQLEAELKQRYEERFAKKQHEFETLQVGINEQKQQLEEQKRDYQRQLSLDLDSALRKERLAIEKELKSSFKAEHSQQLENLKIELSAKSEQVKQLHQSQAEVEKLKREKNELKDKIELEAQQKISRELAKEKEKIQHAEEQKAQMRVSEREEVINQLKEQLKSAQRKAEQGSTQLQGEVQELAIEAWLASQFPLDDIREIKKGERGADCLQSVNATNRPNCGVIYYESKRTKHFQPAWIEKFKADIRAKNADIGVLVTEAMPAGMERMGLVNGVWVCSFDEFKGLCQVLRETIIRVDSVVSSQENRGDKMNLLYSFLTSNEFRLQIEGIVEGFTQMKSDLDAEKRAMQNIWKKREKQIDKVLINTTDMYGSIKGIARNAIQSIPLLELGDGDLLE